MTIKQKLLVLTVILIAVVTLISLFFIGRIGAISKTYQKVAEVTIPLQKITSAMTVALLDAKLNVNRLVKIDRDSEKFTALKAIIQTKITNIAY
jgi:hypothetical protein